MAQRTLPEQPWRLAAGVALTAFGALTLLALIYAFNCGGAACERAMLGLGLAGSALIAGIGQFALLAGLRLIWVALRGVS